MNNLVSIVDYGMGNIGSLTNMFRYIGAQTEVISTPSDVLNARKLLLPGVGAFDAAMKRIDDLGLRGPLRQRALEDQVPMLGICLGMQLLGRRSEEGHAEGLNLVAAETKKFPTDGGLKVPHMGWNEVSVAKSASLTKDLPDSSRFYFVHSYFVEVDRAENVMLRCLYGGSFTAGICAGNIFGAQFHPEKSHKFGMAFLKSFADLPC